MSKGIQINLVKNEVPDKYEALLHMLITQHWEMRDTLNQMYSWRYFEVSCPVGCNIPKMCRKLII